MTIRLYTFAISHFSEKARWALDAGGIEYDERVLIPGAHLFTVRRLASETSVPVLVHDGRVVQGSSAIIDYAEDRLGAARSKSGDAYRTRELEVLADKAFGRGIQTIFYATLLGQRGTTVDLWTQRGPWWGGAFYAVAYPMLARVVRRAYSATPDGAARAADRFRQAMDETDAVLESSPYLSGEAPGRLDVTVASLLAPMCRPPEHSLRWPAMPAELAAFTEQFEDRPTFAHVLRMYREHRRRSIAGR